MAIRAAPERRAPVVPKLSGESTSPAPKSQPQTRFTYTRAVSELFAAEQFVDLQHGGQQQRPAAGPEAPEPRADPLR